ncbi:hypothetical protein [Kocuria sp. U4B]
MGMVHQPGTKTRGELPHQQKLHIWAEEAVRILSEEVATEYGGYITYTQLAERVVENTGRTTKMQQRYWIGNVLGKVLQRCRRRRLPALSALVVRADTGMVGEGFGYWLELTGEPPQESEIGLEYVAAAERLKCYRAFSPDVPMDATPQFTPLYEATLRGE